MRHSFAIHTSGSLRRVCLSGAGFIRPLLSQLSQRRTLNLLALVSLLAAPAGAQSLLFDFDNAPVHTPLPISLTVGGITAHFSATGQGFSIQPADSLGFTPVGFAGYCIYPSSIYAADLLVSFSTALTDFSILYAPEEYACDSSATMRVTAFQDGVMVGTAVTNAQAGTWPSETLRLSSAQPFDIVMVHYDQPPVTGGDWGPIFMADNMTVTPAPLPMRLTTPARLADGTFQLTFTNWPNLTFTAFGSTNLTLPFSNWTSLGAVTEVSPGQFQFADSQATTLSRRFYCVTSP